MRAPSTASFEHVGVLLAHIRLDWLLQHFSPRLVWAVYVCVNGFITIGLLALLALVTGSPFVFPSLGPTAYLFFFSPLAEVSSLSKGFSFIGIPPASFLLRVRYSFLG